MAEFIAPLVHLAQSLGSVHNRSRLSTLPEKVFYLPTYELTVSHLIRMARAARGENA